MMLPAVLPVTLPGDPPGGNTWQRIEEMQRGRTVGQQSDSAVVLYARIG
jgi:hypothetical protein